MTRNIDEISRRGETMKWQRKSSVFLVLLLNLVLLITMLGCDLDQTPKIQSEQTSDWLKGIVDNLKPQKRIVLGYYENPWKGTNDTTGSYPSLKSFSSSLSAVGPFWYKIAKDGTIESKESKMVYDKMHELGLKVYPLITNKSEATDAILGDPDIRTIATDNIVKLVKDNGYDGINIDFELLDPEHRQDLTAFMEELYPKLKALNKVVIISVFPQVEVHESVSGAYDYPQLAKNTDYVQIMTYDRHWSTSEPGAIAPIDWYEKNIQYAVENCGGANKVLVGVSAYGYNWDANNKGETITYADAIVLAEEKGAEIQYDETAEAPYFKYDGHEVWFENARSTAAKLKVVAKYNPGGIAIWRLGQEEPGIWQEINQIFPKI